VVSFKQPNDQSDESTLEKKSMSRTMVTIKESAIPRTVQPSRGGTLMKATTDGPGDT